MVTESLVETVKELSNAFLDAYVLIDPSQKIVEFNRVFFSLFPRAIARKLKRSSLSEVLRLELAGSQIDLAGECLEKAKPLRYDEIVGRVDEETTYNLIVGAVPLLATDRTLMGAFICMRDVTDEAQVQVKYKTMLEEEAREREILETRIREADKDLLSVKDHLNAVESELLNFKKGLLV